MRTRLLLALALLILNLGVFGSEPAVPSISTILSNLVSRSQQTAATTNIWLRYNRSALLHQLDSKERIDSKSRRKYWVVVGGGQTESTLISVDDQPVDDGEEEDKRRQRRRDFAVTHQMVAKYSFSSPRLDELDGRKSYVLNFQPRPGLDDDGIVDKILNRLGGTIWVDAEEYEVARLDVKLLTPASFYGGFVGSISKIHLTARKQKVTPNFWTNTSVFIEMKGRKVLAGFHFKVWETATDFTPLPDPMASAQP